MQDPCGHEGVRLRSRASHLGPWQTQVAACALAAVCDTVCGRNRRQMDHEKLRGLHLGVRRGSPIVRVIEVMGQEVAAHCAAKGRLLSHRFVAAPPDVEQGQGPRARAEAQASREPAPAYGGRRQTVGMRQRRPGLVGRRGLGVSRAGIVGGGRLSGDCREASSRCAGPARPMGLVCNVCNLKASPSTGAFGNRFAARSSLLLPSSRDCLAPSIGSGAQPRSAVKLIRT